MQSNNQIISDIKSVMGDSYIVMDISNKNLIAQATSVQKLIGNNKVILFAENSQMNAFQGFPLHKFIMFNDDNFISLGTADDIKKSKCMIKKTFMNEIENECVICFENAGESRPLCKICGTIYCFECYQKTGGKCSVCRCEFEK
jgi:hypothetical protein